MLSLLEQRTFIGTHARRPADATRRNCTGHRDPGSIRHGICLGCRNVSCFRLRRGRERLAGSTTWDGAAALERACCSPG